MPSIVSAFIRDESGNTVIEYTMIATLVAGVIFAAAWGLGAWLSTSIADIALVLE